MEIILWDIYEIITESTPITGVMLRGRIRKFGLDKGRNILTENAKDVEDVVRFAIPTGETVLEIINYICKILPDVKVNKVLDGIPNPVLSKLKVNMESRYTL